MLSVKQGNIKYNFMSLWYDSTWDWTPVSRAIGEHPKNNKTWYYTYFVQNFHLKKWFLIEISMLSDVDIEV